MLNPWGRFAPTLVGETFPPSHNLPPGSRDLLLQGFSENALLGEGSWEQIKCRMVSPKRDSFRQRHATYTDGRDRQGGVGMLKPIRQPSFAPPDACRVYLCPVHRGFDPDGST